MQKRNIATAVVFALWLSAASAKAEPISGPIVNPANGDTYYLLSQNTATGAEADAVLLGGHLATVLNQAENTWLYNTFGDYGGVHRLLWIGLHDINGTFDWQWNSGAPFAYSNWASGTEPNNEGIERFVYMYGPGFEFDSFDRRPGYWNNYQNFSTEFGGSTPIYGIAEVPPALGSAVPELSSLILLGIAIACMAGYGWRRRKLAAA